MGRQGSETRDRRLCEFALIRYVPDPVKGEFANIGVLLREADTEGQGAVRFTRDWSRVRCLHPDADTEMLESLESEVARFLSQGVEAGSGNKSLLEILQDSLSNSVQITPMQGTLAESLPAEMEQLLRMYVEPLKAVSRGRSVGGRTALANRMRDEFTKAGVWELMRKRIPASQYTRPGDPLKLDCGYRNGAVRMFHAVSLERDAELAKGLAFSLGALQAGVQRMEALSLELTAVVEPRAVVSDEDQYSFGLHVMEDAGLRVMTISDLPRMAETAKRELRA